MSQSHRRSPVVSRWIVSGVVPVEEPPGTDDLGLCFQSDPSRGVSGVAASLSVAVLQQSSAGAYAEYVESPLKRAYLKLIYGQLLDSWVFYKSHDYVSEYGSISPFGIPAYRRAATRMTFMLMQRALAALGKPLETFIVSRCTTIENYGRVGGLGDTILGKSGFLKAVRRAVAIKGRSGVG